MPRATATSAASFAAASSEDSTEARAGSAGRSRRSARAPAVGVVVLAALLAACFPERATILRDDDGDGLFDVAIVGDTDGNGSLELRDVQQAIASLDDPGAKRVELQPGRIYRPGDLLSLPVGQFGLVELPSDTTLDCKGSRIEGVDRDAFDLGTWSGLLATVTNADHGLQTASEVHIRDCEITGGMPPSYSGLGFPHWTYMGVALIDVTNASIVGSHVHDTVHACIYVKNVIDLLVEGNEMERCGASGHQGASPTQPGFYLHQTGTRPVERVVVRNNSVVHAGNSLYNIRLAAANTEYRTAWIRDVRFEQNYGEDDDGDYCFGLRGPREIVVKANTCVRTGGLILGTRNDRYCSDNPTFISNGPAEADCVEDIRIESNLFLENTAVSSNGILSINDYHDGVVLVGNTVAGVSGDPGAPSFEVEMPVRGLSVETLALSGCAGSCVSIGGAPQIGVPADERISLSGILADGAGEHGRTLFSHACFHVASRLEQPLFENVTALRCSGAGFHFGGELVDATLSGFHIDHIANGYRGSYRAGVDAQPACNAASEDTWVAEYAGDGTCTGTTGSQAVRCACRSGAWSLFTPTNSPGIQIDQASNFFVEDGVIDNVDAHAGILFSQWGSHVGQVTDVTLRQPALGGAVQNPMSYGIRDQSGVGAIAVSGATCEPGAVSVACVEVP